MSLIRRLLHRESPELAQQGPLYDEVRAAMKDVQAYARSHGGDIRLLQVDDAGDVRVEMVGACRGCPMADLTLRIGIEEQLKAMVPGVRRVVAK